MIKSGKVIFTLAVLCFYSATSFSASFSPPENRTIANVKEALTRDLCFEVYWYGWNRRQGIPLTLLLKVESEKFFAWIEAAEVYQTDPIDLFMIGRFKNDSGAVVRREGYNARLGAKVPGYSENRLRFKIGKIVSDTITIPTDCIPHYDPSTPEKERMLNTVVSTIAKELNWLVRQGRAKYPREVTLIIANFNVDYPETWVLVEPSGNPQFNSAGADLYGVALHNPQDYDSDEYERHGEYPSSYIPVKASRKSLIEKIRKHAIVKKIVLKE